MSVSAEKSGLSTPRLLALADGIFAIAMTLLVFEIRVPQGVSSQSLPRELLAMWPKYASCCLSFLTLGFSWIGHHNQYLVIRRTDRWFLWINLAFLGCMAFVPFGSGLLGEYPFERASVLVYAGICCVSACLLWLHWRYATGGLRLVDPATPPGLIAETSRRVATAPVAYLAVIALAFVSHTAALVGCLAIPVYFMIPGRVDRHWQ